MFVGIGISDVALDHIAAQSSHQKRTVRKRNGQQESLNTKWHIALSGH